MTSINRNKVKAYFSVALIYFIVISFFTYPAILRMDKDIYGQIKGTDNRGTLWSFWWDKYSYSQKMHPDKIEILAAPYGTDQSDIPAPFMWKFMTRWMSILTNEIFNYNFWIFLSFLLSAFFMYLVVLYLTQNHLAGFVSGLIYGFCPYHFNKAWEHYLLAQIQWMPLFILSIIKIYNDKKINISNFLLYVFSFTFILIFEFTYMYMMGVFVVSFIAFLIYQRLIKGAIKKDKGLMGEFRSRDVKFICNFLIVFLIGLVLNFTNIFPIIKAFLSNPASSQSLAQEVIRPFRYLFAQSAHVSNYFLPAIFNPVLGKITQPFLGSFFYGRTTIENTLYLGWMPLFLSFIAWRSVKLDKIAVKKTPEKNQNNALWVKLFLFVAFVSIMFSLPPYWNLGIFKIYFPSFFIYKILPIFRAYARFGILTMLSISILAGLGLNKILLNKPKKKKVIITALVCFVILFEFNNIPPFRYTKLDNPPLVYKWLSQQKGDFIIAEYPLGEWSQGETYLEMDYLLNQRYHKKRLLNGARPNTKPFFIKEMVLNISAPQTPNILSWLGVKYVILHLDRYREASSKKAVDVIGEIPNVSDLSGYKQVKRFVNEIVLEVTAPPINPEGILKDRGIQND